MELRNFRPLKWFGINGIVLWPLVIFSDPEPPAHVRNHEAIHFDQIKRIGVFRFYFLYLKEYFLGRWDGLSHNEAYRNISFEREAYENQYDALYLVTKSSKME
ncbi:MAG: hypothetical protein ACJ76H_06225 [Bacteriovoracaceae bacterium]